MKALAFYGGGVSTLARRACSASLIPCPSCVACTACLRVSGARVHVSLAAPCPGPLPSLQGSDYPWPFPKGTGSSLTFTKGECKVKEGRERETLLSGTPPLLLPPRVDFQVETFIWGTERTCMGQSLTFEKRGYPGQRPLLEALVVIWLSAWCGGEEGGMREAGLAGGQGGLEINAQPEKGGS